jgi:flagellar biosynthesis protein
MSDLSRSEKLQKAVALFYDGEAAPTVTAKGTGEQAQAIVQLAQEHGVPLFDNPGLVEVLAMLELGESIPRELYVAVAHIIAFAYGLQGKTPDMA